MPHIIEITIAPGGETKLETKGFTGPSCRNADQWLRDALGITTTDVPTQEMYGQTCPIPQKVRQK